MNEMLGKGMRGIGKEEEMMGRGIWEGRERWDEEERKGRKGLRKGGRGRGNRRGRRDQKRRV